MSQIWRSGNGTIDTLMAGRSATDLAAVAVGSALHHRHIGAMGVLDHCPIAGHHFGARRFHAIGDDAAGALAAS
jgi:hypothetical protein